MTAASAGVILERHPAAGAFHDSPLRDAGYRVIRTESRDDLWRRLEELRPDLVRLHADEVPNVLELCRAMKGQDSRYRRLLAICRQSGVAPRGAALTGGAEAYLTAPADPEELLAIVGAVLRTGYNCSDVDAGLREPEKGLRLFVHDAPVGIAMFDREMRYFAVSRRWADEYRLDEQDLLCRGHYEVFPDVPERRKAEHQRCLAGRVQPAEEETVSLSKDPREMESLASAPVAQRGRRHRRGRHAGRGSSPNVKAVRRQ